MKYIFTICVSLFFSTLLQAQNNKAVTTTILGTIAGFDTKKPIANATATISGKGISKKVTTDAKGSFSFGNYRLVVMILLMKRQDINHRLERNYHLLPVRKYVLLFY